MKSAAFLSLCLITTNAVAENFGGVEFPDGAKSFADKVLAYYPGSGVGQPYSDPQRAVGILDGNSVALGDQGILIVEFTDNSLTTSGNANYDLWIFEIGPQQESTRIFVSDDGKNWVDVGSASGSTYGIDLDAYIGKGIIFGKNILL